MVVEPLGKMSKTNTQNSNSSSKTGMPNSYKIPAMLNDKNPGGRATNPTDVANVAYLLCLEEASRNSGSVINAEEVESLI